MPGRQYSIVVVGLPDLFVALVAPISQVALAQCQFSSRHLIRWAVLGYAELLREILGSVDTC